MSKLRKRLSKWFFDTAKKFDEGTVYDNCTTIQLPSRNETIIMYDQYHVDKIHAQYMVSDTMLETYGRMKGYEDFIEERIPELLTRGLAEEIMKGYKDEIKKTRLMDSTIYSLDVYMCKPTKKETI